MIEVFRSVRSHQIISTDFDRAGVCPSLSFVRLGIFPAYYWRERGELIEQDRSAREVIGLGCAAEFEFHSLASLKEFLQHYEDRLSSGKEGSSGGSQSLELPESTLQDYGLSPLFVTIPFDCNSHSSSFTVPARIVVPKTAIVRSSSIQNGSFITIYNTDGDFSVAEAALSEIRKFPRLEPDFSDVFAVDSLASSVDVERWNREFQRLERRFSAGELLKVVLAHQFRFPNVQSLGLTQLLRHSQAFGMDNRFRYLMALSESDWLYSRSPERLLSVEGNLLRSEALGGTLGFGENCSTEKLKREHVAIVDQIDRDLRTFGIVPQWGGHDFESLDLGTIKHLWHRVQGVLPRSVSKTDILFALHPTPAVCGLPKESALKRLRNFEQFDRQLYGGPLGVIHGGSWDFMAGLRTVFSANNYFHIPIGVGIVRGACVEEEVAEIYAKLGSL